jgi:hypothetical protein
MAGLMRARALSAFSCGRARASRYAEGTYEATLGPGAGVHTPRSDVSSRAQGELSSARPLVWAFVCGWRPSLYRSRESDVFG